MSKDTNQNFENITTPPLITIGIPVFNGEAYIKKSIESALNQSFSNFQLVISDNASTDNTKAICEYFTKIDKRIKYVRHEINKGHDFNFKFVLSGSKSKYFVWLGVDDYWEKSFLEKNLDVLEKNDNVVGSIGLVEFYGIDNFEIKKNLIFKIKNILRHGSNDEYEKYKHVLPVSGNYEKKASIYLRFNQGSFVYGIFRTEKLKKRMVPLGIEWDLILILNILKDGDLHVIDKVLVHRFVSGINSGSTFINFYKKKMIPLRELIFPESSLFIWCIKNIGVKFVLKNSDWFVLLLIYGWYTIFRDLRSKN